MGETRAVRRIGALAAALTALLGGAAMAADIGVSLRFAKVDGDERFDPLTVFDSLGRPDLFLCFNQNGAAADGWRCLPDEIRARDAVVVPAKLPCANALSCVFRDVAVWPDAPFAFELRDADIDESEVIERGICTLTGGALRCREEIGNATLSLVTDLEAYAPLATARAQSPQTAPQTAPQAASKPAAPAPEAAAKPTETPTETATDTPTGTPTGTPTATPAPDPDAPPPNGVIAAAQTPMLPTLMAAVPVSLDTLRPTPAPEMQAEADAAPTEAAEATEDADLGFTVVAAEPLAAEPPLAAAEPVSLSAPAAETRAEAPSTAPASASARAPTEAEPAQTASRAETAPTPPLVTTSVPASIAIDAAQSGFAALVADLAALHRAATGEARFGFCRDPETALTRAIEAAALPALHALSQDPDVGWRVAHRLAQSLIADEDPAAVAAAEAALAADFNAEPQLFEAALTGRDRAAPLLSAEAAKEIFGEHCG